MIPADLFKSLTFEKAGDCVSGSAWTVPMDYPLLEGHFPGLPVLPGVAIVDISVAFLKAAVPGKSWRLTAVLAAKFQSLLAPGVRVQLSAVTDGDRCRVEWIDADTGRKAADLELEFTTDPL